MTDTEAPIATNVEDVKPEETKPQEITSGEAPTDEPSAEAPATDTKTGDLKSEENKVEEAKSGTIEAKANSDGEAKSKLERCSKSHSNGGKRPYVKKSYEANVKTDFTALPETDDPDEIRKQVEFYFSDSNLPLDKFLYEQVGGTKNKSVPIKVIHNFKRMRHFQPYSAVVEALKESEMLEVTDKDEVRRKVPLPEAVAKANVEDNYKLVEDRALPRSIYAKGFGEEGPTTQFDIEKFFAPFGPINAIRLRRNPEKHFKGSVFVEFESEEIQQNFLALDAKLKFNDKELTIMSKKAYCEMKIEDIKSGKIKPNERRFERNDRGSYRGRGSRGRGDRGDYRRDDRRGSKRDHSDDEGRDRDNWKSRRNDFQKGGYRDRDDRRGNNDRKRQRDGDGNEDNDYGRDRNKKREYGRDRPDNKKDELKSPQIKLDRDGVPIILDTSKMANPPHPPPKSSTNGESKDGDASKPAADITGSPGKKRAREEDLANEGSTETKKTKVEAPSEASRD
ncbi:hypothetical protein K432DRAFT_401396 [Lepidopterella palustris CBS 459.81]|uniref:Uncharacterized protein n=1 Tax=Lepidopterella palustris CBS 459.81 TaxID=1314670 RepID=A0A8E2EI14_9PEZI|nr:hypothetical protein K432DRAFT_401396 [Lepidopterella palustris CBS 459.81]